MKKIIWYFSLLIFFILSLTNIAIASSNSPTFKNVKIESKYKRLVDGNYPQIYGLKDVETQKVVNAKVKGFVSELQKKALDQKLSIALFYKISLLNDNFFSVKFETDANNIEATFAHPDTQIFTFNYDFKNKKELCLRDLFQPNTNYLKPIAKIAINDLMKQEQVDPVKAKNLVNWIKTGAAPKPENYKNFLLTEDKLIIVFSYYQVGPRPFGTPMVEIPYNARKRQLITDVTQSM